MPKKKTKLTKCVPYVSVCVLSRNILQSAHKLKSSTFSTLLPLSFPLPTRTPTFKGAFKKFPESNGQKKAKKLTVDCVKKATATGKRKNTTKKMLTEINKQNLREGNKKRKTQKQKKIK